MKKTFILLYVSITASLIIPQHLPHKIGNEWHYDRSAVPGGISYAARVTDRVLINNIYYWQIDRYDAYSGAFLETVYDRTEGDSFYIRKVACPEELLINFDWPIGHIEVTALGNDCYTFKKLISKFNRDIFGINALSYQLQIGEFCEGYADTIWQLFTPEITKELGCYWADDGRLVGAVLNGVTYGSLYPLPVELIYFNVRQTDNLCASLQWSTSTETNNAGFEILKKKYDSSCQWESLTFVEGHGTCAGTSEYYYPDKNLEKGALLYRIMQHDLDGSVKMLAERVLYVADMPEEFTLEQNYPNPFNPSTTIEYSINVPQHIRLRVYGIMGQEVTTLVNEIKPAGRHTAMFNASDLSSGIYFYTLETETTVRTGRMMLIK